MKIVAIAIGLVGFANFAGAQTYVPGEDQSRFFEQPYRQAEPGMLPPAAYVEMAKKAIKDKAGGKFLFRQFSEPVVTHRVYRNAPPADRDIVAVQFVYEGTISGGGMVGPGFIYNRATGGVPVVQALIRKDGSKIYLGVIKYDQR